MELIRGLDNLRPRHRGTVLTIGNFDGVHVGHHAIIERLGELRGGTLRSCVMLFEPTPREFLSPETAPARLMRLSEKLEALARSSLDQVLCLRFDRGLAQMPPARFVRELLVEGLGVAHVVVGEDFRYGSRRTGTLETLRAAGRRDGFEVSVAPTVRHDGERVSSTRVRAALAAGDFELARRLLGRPYTMSGRVIHGEKLGRTLGYPTVNLPVRRRRTPLHGIFAVRVDGAGPPGMPGVASLGTRPTVAGEGLLLEVHLFDFDGDLYGRRLEVRFVEHLRDEAHFESLEALERQMALDAQQARQVLGAGRRDTPAAGDGSTR
jgi:riboflavin kinase/FMN adenylyltransferase